MQFAAQTLSNLPWDGITNLSMHLHDERSALMVIYSQCAAQTLFNVPWHGIANPSMHLHSERSALMVISSAWRARMYGLDSTIMRDEDKPAWEPLRTRELSNGVDTTALWMGCVCQYEHIVEKG